MPLVTLTNFPFRTRTRWFIKVLKESLKHGGQRIVCNYTVPDSTVLRFHTGVIALPWPAWRLRVIDAWFLQCIPCGVRRTGDGLDALPFAARNSSFPEIDL